MIRVTLGLLMVALLAYSALGAFVVQPNEKVIVRRFGRALELPAAPGLHWDLPPPFARIDRVRVDQARQVVVGRLTNEADSAETVEQFGDAVPGRYLTGDQNLVDVMLTIQFVVDDPSKYLFAAADVDRLVAMAAESLLTELSTKLKVDAVLLGAQASLAETIRQRLESTLRNQYDVGVLIRSVNFTRVAPPAEVADAFNDVIKARNEKERKINDAGSYSSKVEQQSKAKVEQFANEAKGYAIKQAAEATSHARRFDEMLIAYRQSNAPQTVRHRLFLEAMEQILPRLKSKVVVGVDSSEPIDLGILRSTGKP